MVWFKDRWLDIGVSDYLPTDTRSRQTAREAWLQWDL